MLGRFYLNPSFQIKDVEGASSYRKQCAGIHEGCPLSPYLFLTFMSAFMHHVRLRTVKSTAVGKLPSYNELDLLYADDTLIICQRFHELNIILHAIGEECVEYNMRLNMVCLLYTSPSPRDRQKSRMPSSA